MLPRLLENTTFGLIGRDLLDEGVGLLLAECAVPSRMRACWVEEDAKRITVEIGPAVEEGEAEEDEEGNQGSDAGMPEQS